MGTKCSGKASVFESLVGNNCFPEALPLSPGDLSFCSSFMFFLKINGKQQEKKMVVKQKNGINFFTPKISFTWILMKFDKKIKTERKGFQ